MTKNKDLKVQNNQILYYNFNRWLVKETCADQAAAEARLVELQNQNDNS